MKLNPLHPLLQILVLCLILSGCRSVADKDSRELESQSYSGHREILKSRNLQAWQLRAESLRMRILTTSGLYPTRSLGERKIDEYPSVQETGYSTKQISLKAPTGLRLDGSLYLPDAPQRPAPAVLLAHGHKPAGRFTHDQYFSQRAFARHLAQNGYVVLSYDMIGYNDTVELPHTGFNESWYLWGINPMGLQLQNSQAAFHYLQQLEVVDPQRIAMVGWSGGGTQTYLLAAIEPNIALTIPAAVISSSVQDTCDCGTAPNFRLDLASAELAALAAPRPQLIVTANDFTYDTPKEGMPFLRSVYSLLGKDDKLSNEHISTEWHNFNADSRRACYQFLARHFAQDISATESKEKFIDEALMRAGKPQRVPGEEILKAERESILASFKLYPVESEIENYRQAYQFALPLEYPKDVRISKETEEDWVASRAGQSERIPIWFRPGSGQGAWTVLLTAGGISEAKERASHYSGPVIALSPLGLDGRAARAELPKNGPLSYNRSLALEQMQDCLTAISLARHESGQPVKVVGFEKAAAWAILLRPLLPDSCEMTLVDPKIPASEEDYLADLFIPLILRVGSFRTALALSKGQKLEVEGPGLEALESELGAASKDYWKRLN